MNEDPPGPVTGYICPRCGGALSRRTNGQGPSAPEYQCRIGHAFTAAEVWIRTLRDGNRALGAAARAIAENADLARALAEQARARDGALGARLEDEARAEERHVGAILEMLEEIGAGDARPTGPNGRSSLVRHAVGAGGSLAFGRHRSTRMDRGMGEGHDARLLRMLESCGA